MYQEIFENVKKNGKAVTFTILQGTFAGSKCLWKEGPVLCWGKAPLAFWKENKNLFSSCDSTGVFSAGEWEIYGEILQDTPRLVICGGGHVSYHLCKLGKILGYHVTVLDDRREFTARERFPDADCLICCEFDKLSCQIEPYSNAYYVVVTRGHEGDEVCVRQILNRPYQYLGMIGSKSKVAKTKENLLRDGFKREKVEGMYAPIGLKLGGQLPEEIAVGIAAEMIQVKNQRKEVGVDSSISEKIAEKETGVMVTILSKHGSSPRGTGSKMLIGPDRSQKGSIGGGIVEYQAVIEAGKMLDSNCTAMQIREYVLNQEESKSLGMVCGGRIQVMMEPLR